MATKSQRHEAKLYDKIYLCVLVSRWRHKKFTSRVSTPLFLGILQVGLSGMQAQFMLGSPILNAPQAFEIAAKLANTTVSVADRRLNPT